MALNFVPMCVHQAHARRQLLDEYAAVKEQLPALTAEAESTITQLGRIARPARLHTASAKRLCPKARMQRLQHLTTAQQLIAKVVPILNLEIFRAH